MSDDFSQPWAKTQVRDSAAAAGVPSRNNVWEYDYPSPTVPNLQAPSQSSTQFVPTGNANPMADLARRIAVLTGNAPATAWPTASPQSAFGSASSSQPSPDVFNSGAAPVPFLPSAPPVAPLSQEKPGGLLGMMIDAGLIDPANPDAPPAGGLPGMIQEYLRNNPQR
ncbi:hypothetical protein [Bradyrhizobium sp. NP1]|uniref:hypothetical protein n=1 Tax=Bradyrhizobium sp. NP1 TaxID=3049772 RepID=UPI0025A59A52|nr:hypothetical protein [Bradyrhizobium sp. NP1]WJR76477.1 hypothetical protein QOU61_27490 [Bradyrhizobium sp. NP1]